MLIILIVPVSLTSNIKVGVVYIVFSECALQKNCMVQVVEVSSGSESNALHLSRMCLLKSLIKEMCLLAWLPATGF
jgi:hypothetical protein